MATRYVSTSEKTKIIAQGMALYADLMHQISGTPEHDAAYDSWFDWVGRYGILYETFAVDQQTKLFDLINGSEL